MTVIISIYGHGLGPWWRVVALQEVTLRVCLLIGAMRHREAPGVDLEMTYELGVASDSSTLDRLYR